MTQFINNLNWQPTSQVNQENIAVVVCDSAVDQNWQIITEGTSSGTQGEGVQATFAIVDNMANSTTCNFGMGPLAPITVAPFTRRTFAVPDRTAFVTLSLTSGKVNLFLCQVNMGIPDEVNQVSTSSFGQTMSEYNPNFCVTGPTPVADEILYIHFFEEAVMFQPNFNGFQGGTSPQGGIHPAAVYDCLVYRNAIHVGDLSYQTNGTCIATTVGGSIVTYAVDDCMTIVGAHVPDGSIQNFAGTFAGSPV